MCQVHLGEPHENVHGEYTLAICEKMAKLTFKHNQERSFAMSIHRTTSLVQRIAIVEAHQKGTSYQAIAADFGLNYYTVRKWCRRFRDASWTGLERPTARKPGILGQFAPLVRYVALRLKKQHPGWGVNKVLLEMRRHPSLKGLPLPKRSSLHRYYQRFAPRLNRHRPSRNHRPVPSANPVQGVHECWQMDFKGEVVLGPVGKVKPFMVCDAYSSAPLACRIHSGVRGAITMSDVQNNLRQVFSEWGLPHSIRMDRDPIWVGSTRLEFPSWLLLWLVGLDVMPIINRAGRPTDNAQIERCNGIWFEQVGRGQSYNTLSQVQLVSDLARYDRLAHLPSANRHCQQQAPLVVLPQLQTPLRPYHPTNEPNLFQMQRVDHYLNQWRWQRLVDRSGQISLAGHAERLGRAWAGHIVKLHFDPHTQTFIAHTLTDDFLKSFTHPKINPQTICGMGTSPLDSP